jgi:hypothetical protein
MGLAALDTGPHFLVKIVLGVDFAKQHARDASR